MVLHPFSTPTHQVFDGPLYTVDNITEVYMKISSAFSDVIHKNYGNHLESRIQDGVSWKFCCISLTDLPSLYHNLLVSVVVNFFMEDLAHS